MPNAEDVDFEWTMFVAKAAQAGAEAGVCWAMDWMHNHPGERPPDLSDIDVGRGIVADWNGSLY